MYPIRTLGVIKSWMSLIWHNVVKIGVVEKLANFEANFEGEGVEIRENGPDLSGTLTSYKTSMIRKEQDLNFPNIKLDFSYLIWFDHKSALKLTDFYEF